MEAEHLVVASFLAVLGVWAIGLVLLAIIVIAEVVSLIIN
jgi:hypothetical protein